MNHKEAAVMPDDAARAAKLTRVQVAVAIRRGRSGPGPYLVA
jgi:hypothetical protein